MTEEFEAWKAGAIARIKEVTRGYTDPDKEKLNIDYSERLLEKVPRFLVTPQDFAQFRLDVEKLVDAIPEYHIKGSFEYKHYMKLVGASQADLRKRYNLVQKGTFIGLWLSIGVAIGVSFGVAFKNIGLGIPIGIGIGLAIGAGMEQQAQKQNRIL